MNISEHAQKRLGEFYALCPYHEANEPWRNRFYLYMKTLGLIVHDRLVDDRDIPRLGANE